MNVQYGLPACDETHGIELFLVGSRSTPCSEDSVDPDPDFRDATVVPELRIVAGHRLGPL